MTDNDNFDAPIEVRDARPGHWFWVDDAVVDDYGPLLGYQAMLIYISLCCMANKDHQSCHTSLSRLSRHWRLSRPTVIEAIRRLEQWQLIRVERRTEGGARIANRYTLLAPQPLPTAVKQVYCHLAASAGADAATAYLSGLLSAEWEALRPGRSALRSYEEWVGLLHRVIGDTALPSRQPATPGSQPGKPGSQPGKPDGQPGKPGGGLDREPGWSTYETQTRNLIAETVNHLPEPEQQQPEPVGGGIPSSHASVAATATCRLISQEEVPTYPLGENEVLVDSENGVEIVDLDSLVRRDVMRNQRTHCYYSAAHWERDDDDLSEQEEEKRRRHLRRFQEIEGMYRQLGACSVEEALAKHLNQRAARQWLAYYRRADAETQAAVRERLTYLNSPRARGLSNPGGWLVRELQALAAREQEEPPWS